MPDTFSAKQVAVRIGTDAKTLRKFLRSPASPYDAVGQGGRYEFPKGDLATIKKHFVKWQQGKRPSTVPPPQVNGTKPAPPEPKVVEPVVEELDDEEPTMEDLEHIEAEELEID